MKVLKRTPLRNFAKATSPLFIFKKVSWFPKLHTYNKSFILIFFITTEHMLICNLLCQFVYLWFLVIAFIDVIILFDSIGDRDREDDISNEDKTFLSPLVSIPDVIQVSFIFFLSGESTLYFTLSVRNAMWRCDFLNAIRQMNLSFLVIWISWISKTLISKKFYLVLLFLLTSRFVGILY